MSNLTNAVCFTCGLVIESPPRLSRLTNGQVCPACRERVLDGLPPALPSQPSGTGAGSDLRGLSAENSDADERDDERGPDGWDERS
jgi:DNA-directed RNA polymerase subunit RPC12/RpoP